MFANKTKIIFLTLSFLFLNLVFSGTSFSQNQSSNDIEIYVSFKHRSVIRTVVIAYFRDDKVLLPVNELFDLMMIDNQIESQKSIVFGRFLDDQIPYEIDFQNYTASLDEKSYSFTSDEVLITELDYYLESSYFNTIFGLDFTVDLNNLTLSLISEQTIPIVAKLSRELKRDIALNNNVANIVDYPLVFNRDRKIIDGGFIDYNLNVTRANTNNILNYNTSVGLEVLGGDLQGTVIGLNNQDQNILFTQNFRWRYALPGNYSLTTLRVGQSTSTGLLRTNFSGLQVSNIPIEPRRLFDEYQIAGTAEPGSEVEIYLNNSLIDFQNADDAGLYRFLVPLTYGASVLDMRIYEPGGRITTNTQRLQIPFSFIPKGEVNYNVNTGRLDNPLIGTNSEGLFTQADVNAGLYDWLTLKAGVEYYEDFHDNLPTFSTALSSRISDIYLLSAEYASEAFFRTNLNVIYPNASSITVGFTEFTNENGIYNPTKLTRELSANVFYPFRIGNQAFNTRVFTSRRFRNIRAPITRYRVDFNTRVKKFNFRFGYSDTQVSDSFFSASDQSRLFASTTYTIARNYTVNPLLRGFFLRGQVSYFNELRQLEQIEFLASKNVTRTGRFQIVAGRNFLGNFNSLSFNIFFDFLKTRTNTTFRSLGQNTNFTQSIRGSVGLDRKNKNAIFSSRDQVGRSGLALRLFVDNNNTGNFDEGDDLIEDNALRLDRSGFTGVTKDGIQYYTQIQSYFKYNAEVNKNAIKNPLLVPNLDVFGFISDPNYYKPIDIPFYSSGVVEGIVQRVYENEASKGIGGLKLVVTGIDREYIKELRTFSDGSFYDYEIPPGKYEIKVDQSQLDILNVTPNVEKIEFEIEALAEGDFVEGLYFELLPKGARPDSLRDNIGIGVSGVTLPSTPTNIDASGTTMAIEYIEANNCTYRLQVGAFLTKESAELVASMHQQINPKLIYNKARDLFAVRGGYFQTMSSSTREARFVRSFEYPDVAVVNKCYDGVPPSLYRGDYVYILQFAAYDIASKAQKLASTLNSRYNLGAFMIRDKDNLYKVRLGPFEDVETARKKKTEIIDDTFINDVYVTKAAMTVAPQINVEFDYIIQVGEFPNTATAQEYADKLLDDFGIRCKIMVDEEETIQLIVDRNYSDWEEVESIRKKIGGTSGYIVPIIQLVERPVD